MVYRDVRRWPDREISRAEADELRSYLAHYYEGDTLDHTESVSDGKLMNVTYYNRSWPDDDLVQRHRDAHGAVPYSVVTPEAEAGEVRTSSVYEIDGSGVLRERDDNVWKAGGQLLSETRWTPDGHLLGRTEYVYDGDGNLILTREFGSTGDLLDEVES